MPVAKRSTLPAKTGLMLCTLVKAPFDHPDWMFEPKLDGLRVEVRFDGKTLYLLSRNGKSQDFQFPDIHERLLRMLTKPVILDGEIVCFDENGRPSFERLQQRFHLTDRATVLHRMKNYPAYLYLFDILFFDRFDLRDLPLLERRKCLKKAVRSSTRIRLTDFVTEHGIAAFGHACRNGLEGIVAKRLDSPYRAARGEAWLKMKCSARQEFVIGGFTEPQGSRIGFGALLVGYFSGDNSNFIYAGKVGTGFSDKLLSTLRKRLERIEVNKSPFTQGDTPRGRDVHWVKPQLVAEVAFAEWTQVGMLRQPRFEGLRDDKPAAAVHRERPKTVAKG